MIFEWPVTVPWRLSRCSTSSTHVLIHATLAATGEWLQRQLPESYIGLLYDMRAFPDTKSIAELQRRGVTVLVLHEERGTRPSYVQAVERLLR